MALRRQHVFNTRQTAKLANNFAVCRGRIRVLNLQHHPSSKNRNAFDFNMAQQTTTSWGAIAHFELIKVSRVWQRSAMACRSLLAVNHVRRSAITLF
jgi:hypothetical protein